MRGSALELGKQSLLNELYYTNSEDSPASLLLHMRNFKKMSFIT